jgi:hypothetical protein
MFKNRPEFKVLPNDFDWIHSPNWFWVFCVGTCLDGLLTYFGVSHNYGLEGAPLANAVVPYIGLVPYLMVTRVLGILSFLPLYLRRSRGAQMCFCAVVVFLIAVIPWSMIIAFHMLMG